MEVKFKIDFNDYLTYQLFTASKSAVIKRSRLRRWLGITSLFVSFAIIFYTYHVIFLAYYFAVASLVVFFIYPTFYLKWLYKRHYSNHVKNVYKNNFDIESIFKISEEFIEISEENGEVKIKISQITEINEIADYYFIQLLSGSAFIIPKKKIENIVELANKIKELASKWDIKYNTELNWKWK